MAVEHAWRTDVLGNVVTLQRGFDLPTGARRAGGVPVVTSAGITDFHDTPKVAAPGVVTGRYGTIGELFFLSESFWPLNTTLYVRDFHGNEPRFVYYLLQRFDFKTFSGKSGVPGVNRNELHRELVSLPADTKEQRAIATALNDVDALLGALDRLIAKKRNLKQAAMQQLLTGQTRLPGFSGEWEVKRLGELADIRSGGTPSTTDGRFWDGDVPWCTPTDITALDGRKCLNSTTRTITPAGLAASSAEIIPAFSVVMTSRATIGECAINTVPLSTNQGFKNFVPFEEIDGEFLYYLLSTQKQGFIRLCGGSTFLEIGKTQLVAYEVRLPTTKDEQTAIAAVLSEMDAEIAALEARRAKTRDLKQAMMQELLTGRTRLVESNVIALPEQETTSTKRKANVHFVRSVFAAEIIDRLHAEPTFGHVKCQKLIYLAERMCGVDIDSHYHRDAAGPYDNRALRSIDRQLRAQKWFDAQSTGERYRYVPMEKRGGHKAYFDRYFADVGAIFDKVVDALRRLDTERCEIIATLFEAWHDLLARKVTVTDDAILREVLDHWHESKKRIDEDRWRRALGWMREKGFTPQDGKRP
jgi:type I restriction enzyme S subunit